MEFFKKIFIILFCFLYFSPLVLASGITVKITERIPGAGCGEAKDDNGNYTCTIEPGFNSVSTMIGNIIKWLTAIVALAGVLFIVINGIMLSMGAFEKDKVKERIIKAISGLVILLLSGLILNMIAPWIYK